MIRPDPEPLVLIVDDEDMIRTLVRALLETNGYRVIEAENGRRATALIESDRATVDLLITDVRMPGLSGPELVRNVRAVRPTLPILVMSGFTGDERLEPPGDAMEHLAKPFALPSLLAAVRRLLKQSCVPV